MKRVLLHIGTCKTDSTAIARTLAKNREQLRTSGIIYEGTHPQTENHLRLACAVLQEALTKAGYPQEIPALAQAELDADRELERIFTPEGSQYIISFPGLFAETYRMLHGLNRNYDPGLETFCNSYIRENLAYRLGQYAEELTLVCYLRRQDLYLEALYNEYCKAPWTDVDTLPDFHEFVAQQPAHLDYDRELREWERYFGKAEMIIRNDEPEFLPQGVVHDFLETAAGLPFEKIALLQKTDRTQENPPLSRDALETKRILYPKMPQQGLHKLFQEYAVTHPQEKEYAYFSLQERMELLERYEESNANAAREFLGRSPEPLFWDSNCLFPTYSGLTKERFDEIMGWLVQKLD